MLSGITSSIREWAGELHLGDDWMALFTVSMGVLGAVF